MKRIYYIFERILVGGLIWLGTYYWFSTLLDTNWPHWLDVLCSLCWSGNLLWYGSFRSWLLCRKPYFKRDLEIQPNSEHKQDRGTGWTDGYMTGRDYDY
jgi:hypothetical protein